MKLLQFLLIATMALSGCAKENAPKPKTNLVKEKVNSMLLDAKKSIKSIEPKQLHKMIEDEEDFLLVDVREADEVASGKIEHLEYKSFPSGLLPFKIKPYKTDTKIVVYCKGGDRAALAVKLLNELGYKNVSNLKGGIKAWLKAGYEVETKLGTLVLKK